MKTSKPSEPAKMLSFTGKTLVFGLALASAFVTPVISQITSRYIFTVFTSSGENNMYVYTPTTRRQFAIAKSPNGVDWALHKTVDIASTSIARTWAPEIFKDPSTGKVHIIVSLDTTLSDFRPYLYTATDSTLSNWGTAEPMRGIEPNYIRESHTAGSARFKQAVHGSDCSPAGMITENI
ncbi:hypothetical protein L873DRAFT_1792024 [Choiromyces venosus 120613-1]|uniref:Uncharacterized protein n=1 Tax=Choiromyces venosus 120613-1 TaxID=1336337 RepID=A0A3N4JFN4_9PEZI|nr:hypothetical protein L873DRAFT_1792024 [Choiromyces venosus 120613-1]